jgi:hypothetical protein
MVNAGKSVVNPMVNGSKCNDATPPPKVKAGGSRMQRLDQKFKNSMVGSPFVIISANCSLMGTWRTRTCPMETFSWTK